MRRLLIIITVGLLAWAAPSARAADWTLGAPAAFAQAEIGHDPVYSYIGCSTPGNCVAVGTAEFDHDDDGYKSRNPIGAQELNGVWQAGQRLSGSFAVVNGYVSAQVRGIACVPSGGCLIIGLDENNDRPFQIAESGGSFGGASSISLPGDVYTANGDPPNNTAATGVACASATRCVVVGFFESTSSRAVTAGYTSMAASGTVGGVSGFAATQAEPTTTAESSSLDGVGCVPDTQTCVATGIDGSEEAQVQVDSGGGWSGPQEVTTGGGAGGYGWEGLDVACPKVGDCTLMGIQPTTYQMGARPFAIQQTDGTWGTPTQLSSGGAVSSAFRVGELACVSAGNCVIGASGGAQGVPPFGLIALETSGTWDGFKASPEPADKAAAGAPHGAGWGSPGVACAAARCDVLGEYYNADGNTPYSFTASQAPPTTTTSISCARLTDGTTNYGCKTTVADASGAAPPGTPTGAVSLTQSIGSFPNGRSCTLAADSTAGSASCTLEYDPGAGYGTPVTISADYPDSGTFTGSQGKTTFTPECDQDPTESDGDWQFGGCFTNPDATDYDTESTSSLDGMEITPTDTANPVDYSTGGSGGQAVSPPGGTSLSLNVSSLSGGSQGLVTLTNQLQKLTLSGGPVTIPLPSGFKLMGLPLTGGITFKALPGGTAVGTVAGKLPEVLGGGPASLTVTTTFSGHVTSIVAEAASGTLANVYGLRTLKLSYAKSTWTVNATALGAGGKTQTLAGTLTYNPAGKLTAGSLVIKNVVLAGLLDVKTFSVSYDATKGWSGAADLAQGKQSAKVTFAFSDAGVMKSGSITASGVKLFQVFELTQFSMTYEADKDKWGLSLTVEGKKDAPKVKAALSVVQGTVEGADLDFRDVAMLKKITINHLHLNYKHAGVHDDFSGEAKLELPSTAVSGVEGEFRMVDGEFKKGKLILHGNVPLYGALTLNDLGAGIDLEPDKVFTGYVGLSAGPKTDKGALLALEHGEISYTFPGNGHDSRYSFSGELTALGKTLGEAKLTAENDAVKLHLKLGEKGEGFKIGHRLTAEGSIVGGLHHHAFHARGRVHFEAKIGGREYKEEGSLVASNDGVWACATIPAVSEKGDSGVFIAWNGEGRTYEGDCPY